MHRFILLLMVLLAGCAKERLNGEVEVLQGTWKTKFISGTDYGTHASISSNDENYYELRFTQKGKVYLYDHDGKIIERGRVVTYSSHHADEFPYSLYVNVSIKSNQLMFSKLERISSIAIDGFYNDQIMRISDFLNDRGIDELYFSK